MPARSANRTRIPSAAGVGFYLRDQHAGWWMANGGGAADPRELVPTGGQHLATGTVATFGSAPNRRPAPVFPGFVLTEDRERFAALGRMLDRLGVPEPCWDGGPVSAFAIEKIIAANTGLPAGGIRYPLYRRDRQFDRWRNAPGRSAADRHRANCAVQLRWVMRAKVNAAPAQLVALQRLLDAADWNILAEDQKRNAQAERGRLRADQRRTEIEHRRREWRAMLDACPDDPPTKGDAAPMIAADCRRAGRRCKDGTVRRHLEGA